MKCHYLTADQRRIVRAAAKEEAARQMEDISSRAQYLWMAAMLNAGLSPKTVARVLKSLAEVTDSYSDAKCNGAGDAMLIRDLRRAGFDVSELNREQ